MFDMITTMITGAVYAALTPGQSSSHKADSNSYMNEVRSILVTQEFGEALVNRAEDIRVEGVDLASDVVDSSVYYEPPKGDIVDAWA